MGVYQKKPELGLYKREVLVELTESLLNEVSVFSVLLPSGCMAANASLITPADPQCYVNSAYCCD